MNKYPLLLVVVLLLVLSNCQTSPTQSGAMGGAALGAVAGQLIGGDTKGTLIGAGAGALLGGLANDAYSTKKQQTYQQGYNDALQEREYREFQDWRRSQGYDQQPINYYSSPGGYYQSTPAYYQPSYYYPQPPSYNQVSLSYHSSKVYNTRPRGRGYEYYGSGVPGDEYMQRTSSGEWITKGSINGDYHPGDDLSNFVSPNTKIYKHQFQR